VRVLREAGIYTLVAVAAVAVFAAARVYVIQPFRVPSESMEQTLIEGDRIWVLKPGGLARGDIIVFRDDLGWLPPSTDTQPGWRKLLSWLKLYPPLDEQYVVKRLVGLPGDRVSCCDRAGRLAVNGQVLDESSYLYFTSPGSPQPQFDVVVPQSRVFVMGDHRDRSGDTRFHMCTAGSTATPTPALAFPTLESVQGRVLGILGPLDRTQRFHIPATWASVPDATESPPVPASVQWTCPLVNV
jgi:signal peptidase I